jgi:GNAT superfamily N-acetyltransferase
MGRLHVRAWQRAYRGIMPDEYLDGLQPDERIAMWRDRIPRTDLPPLLVAVLAGEVAGFAAFGAERSITDPTDPTGPTGCGELYAMNLDPPHWGKGIGRALLRQATDALRALNFHEAVLWVIPENTRAVKLYESEGWVADGAVSTEEILGVVVTDVRYRTQLAP